MPTFEFTSLKTMVKATFKVDPDKMESSVTVPKIVKEIKAREFRNLISFDFDGEGGIYYKENGKTYKGFLYIPIYNQVAAAEKGWNTMPRFHTAKCRTIARQMDKANFNGHYVFANTPVIDMTDVDGIAKDLKLCGNCRTTAHYTAPSTTQFCKDYVDNKDLEPNLTRDEIPREYQTDAWGYTPKWAEISKAYRFKQKFTCEDCGIHLDGAAGYYLDTHHINGNKTDNRPSNFKCLCVLCHANVNEHHIQNFSFGRNHKRLQDFLNAYGDALKSAGNRYI